MPITVKAELRRVSQDEFAQVAFEAMGVFFSVHNEMGRLFREQIYKEEVAQRHGRIECEVPVKIEFEDFSKHYFIDMLVCGCAVFEVKAGRILGPDDRAQLMHYLMLSELPRGKLLNVRPEAIEHEFVNSLALRRDRTRFQIVDQDWQPVAECDEFWKEWLSDAIRDWGADLEKSLYLDAIVHVLGGIDRVKKEIEVVVGDRVVGKEEVLLSGPESMVRVTAFRREPSLMREHLSRYLAHTRLEAIQWVNVTRRELTFCTVRRSPG